MQRSRTDHELALQSLAEFELLLRVAAVIHVLLSIFNTQSLLLPPSFDSLFHYHDTKPTKKKLHRFKKIESSYRKEHDDEEELQFTKYSENTIEEIRCCLSVWQILIIERSRTDHELALQFLASGRVRVAVRLRPQNAEETVTDVDFVDCVEL
nr:kinesin-like protein KIN-UB [Tanacetum cinerariifolium]